MIRVELVTHQLECGASPEIYFSLRVSVRLGIGQLRLATVRCV